MSDADKNGDSGRSPNASGTTSAEAPEERRRSLSDKLRKLANKQSGGASSADRAAKPKRRSKRPDFSLGPTLPNPESKKTPAADPPADEPDDGESLDATDRTTPPDGLEATDPGDDSDRGSAPRDVGDIAPDDDTDRIGDDTDRLGDPPFDDFQVEQTELSPGLQDSLHGLDAKPATGDSPGDGDNDFQVEQTELSPGLQDSLHDLDAKPATHDSPGDGDDDFQVEQTELSPGLQDSVHGLDSSSGVGDTLSGEPTDPVEHIPSTVPATADTPTSSEPKETLLDNQSVLVGEPEEGAFDVEPTAMYTTAFESEPITPRLSALDGPAAGQDFLITDLRNSIGRATKNSVSVPDLSMSRQHFEILEKPDSSYRIRDLKAVNGTLLNGIPIEESDLFHGDKIEAGKTTFQFIIPGDVPVGDRNRQLIPARSTETQPNAAQAMSPASTASPAKVPARPRERLLLAITVGATILSIPLLGFLVHTTLLSDDDQPQASASKYYFAGAEAYRNQEWNEAREFFGQSADIDPDFGDISAQLSRIEREEHAAAIIDEARDVVGNDMNDDLLSRLRSIPADSSYHDDAQSLLSVAPHDESHMLVEQAQQAYDNEQFEESARLTEHALQIAPRHEVALSLQEDLADVLRPEPDSDDEGPDADDAPPAIPADEPPGTEDPQPNRLALLDDTDAATDDSPDEPSSSSSSSQSINFFDGFNLYRDGRFDDALHHFASIADVSDGAVESRARRTAGDIARFQETRQRADRQMQSANYDEAVASYQEARQADEAIVSGGAFGDSLGSSIAEALAEQGLSHLDHEQFSRAREYWERAQAHDADHDRVHHLLQQLERRANALYIRAVNQRKSDPDGAAFLYQSILTLVPPDSETHQRAQQMLEDLQ